MADELVKTGQRAVGGIAPRALTPAQYAALAELPPELQWFANIRSPKTRRAYQIDLDEFRAFIGIKNWAELRSVTRPHVMAWRNQLETRGLSPATVARKLSALSSLFRYLSKRNVVPDNPVDIERPLTSRAEGETPILSDAQARKLLEAPPAATLKGARDRAVLATFLYHGLRCAELRDLRVKDIQSRKGVMYFRVRGKREKVRYVEIHPGTLPLIYDYLALAGHQHHVDGPLFRPLGNRVRGLGDKSFNLKSVYRMVHDYAVECGINSEGNPIGVHSMRATACTNALDNEADLRRVKQWMGHAHISTTELYDRRRSKPEESPTFRVKY
jgi:integrase/recombinase XerD